MIALNLFRRHGRGRQPSSRRAFDPQLECLGQACLDRSPARPLGSVRLGLEALESRVVPTGVIATVQHDTSFVLLQNGQLWEHVGTTSSTGWYYVWNNVKQVSAGADPALKPAAFVLFNDGTLWEHHGQDSSTGWNYIWSGVASVAASELWADDAYIILKNGTAYEHRGFSTSNWYYIWGNVKSISAGADASYNPAAFVLFNDGTLWEHEGQSSSTGWTYIWSGVSSMTASQLGINTVYMVLNNGTAYEHVGDTTSNWYYIWGNVRSISVGDDTRADPTAFVVFNDGTLYEHTGQSSSTGWRYIWSGVTSASGSEVQADTAFVRLSDGTAYENNDGTWSYIWYGVAA